MSIWGYVIVEHRMIAGNEWRSVYAGDGVGAPIFTTRDMAEKHKPQDGSNYFYTIAPVGEGEP